MTRPESLWLGISLVLFAVSSASTGGPLGVSVALAVIGIANIAVGLLPPIDEDY